MTRMLWKVLESKERILLWMKGGVDWYKSDPPLTLFSRLQFFHGAKLQGMVGLFGTASTAAIHLVAVISSVLFFVISSLNRVVLVFSSRVVQQFGISSGRCILRYQALIELN